jgi:hypothetical protein
MIPAIPHWIGRTPFMYGGYLTAITSLQVPYKIPNRARLS